MSTLLGDILRGIPKNIRALRMEQMMKIDAGLSADMRQVSDQVRRLEALGYDGVGFLN